MGADVGNIPRFHDNYAMRNFSYDNGRWEAFLSALSAKLSTQDLDMNRHLLKSSGSREVVNMPRFRKGSNIATVTIQSTCTIIWNNLNFKLRDLELNLTQIRRLVF